MIDISHYCAKSDIKPEIACVYIKNDGKCLETVATDSYRLARIVYPFSTKEGAMLETIYTGLYDAKAFKVLCTTFNKKKSTVSEKMKAIQLLQVQQSPFNYKHYPDYNQLIPTSATLQANEGILGKYNAKYLIDHIELLARLKQDGTGTISMGDIYDSSKRMNVYHDKETGNTLLLMQVIR